MYIDSNLEHLLASNFTESLLLRCSNACKILRDISDVYFRQIFSKISEKKCCFLNNKFRKLEIAVYFALLLHGFDRNTQFSINSLSSYRKFICACAFAMILSAQYENCDHKLSK